MKNTIPNATVPMISSVASGSSGDGGGCAAARCTDARCTDVRCTSDPARYLTIRPPLDPLGIRTLAGLRLLAGGREDERDDDPDQGERLGEGEPDVHIGADHPGGLGLAGHGLDTVSEDQADADAGADGREAVAERPEVNVQLGYRLGGCFDMNRVKHVYLPL